MEVFEALLNNAQKEFKANQLDKAFASLHAALKYLKGVIDAAKLLVPEPPEKP